MEFPEMPYGTGASREEFCIPSLVVNTRNTPVKEVPKIQSRVSPMYSRRYCHRLQTRNIPVPRPLPPRGYPIVYMPFCATFRKRAIRSQMERMKWKVVGYQP